MGFDIPSWLPQMLQLAGTGVKAYGAYRQGQDAADVYEYNRQIARYKADAAQKQADVETAALERQVAKTIGRQRAIAGASGTVTDSGSNLDALLETRRQADIDAALIRYNADLASYGYGAEADLLGLQAGQMRTGSYINVGSTLLAGASKYDYKKKTPKTKKPGYVKGSAAYSMLPPT